MIIVRQLLPKLLECFFLHVVGRSGFQKSGAAERRNSNDTGLVRAHVLPCHCPLTRAVGFSRELVDRELQKFSRHFRKFIQLNCAVAVKVNRNHEVIQLMFESEKERANVRGQESAPKTISDRRRNSNRYRLLQTERGLALRVLSVLGSMFACMHVRKAYVHVSVCLLSTGVTSDSFNVLPSLSNEARISSRDRDPLPDRKKTFAHSKFKPGPQNPERIGPFFKNRPKTVCLCR
jgi:hypothetical protein